MTEDEKIKILSNWMEVEEAAIGLFLAQFRQSADSDGFVNRDAMLAAITTMAGMAGRIIKAVSTDTMQVPRIHELFNTALDGFLTDE